MLIIRALLFYSVYVPISIIYGTVSFILLYLPRGACKPILTLWSTVTVEWLRITCNVRYEIKGSEHFTELKGPCVIVANHQSPWETYFLQGYFMPVSIVLKEQLTRIPFFGWGLRLYDPIPINRDDPIASLRKIKKEGGAKLASGRHVLIFPEGTRMPVGELGNYARSAADIAKSAGVPILPVTHNAGHCWLNKKFLKRPGKISVVIGEPIYIGDQSTKAVMQSIQQWSEEILTEL